MFQIHFIERNQSVVTALEAAFAGQEYVTVMRGNICQSPVTGPDVAVAAPANSFGKMDGGADRTINYMLSSPTRTISTDVANAIRTEYCGEQPVGTCMLIRSLNPRFGWLAHVPTMRVPKDVSRSFNAYHAFRAMLVSVLNHNKRNPHASVNSILCTSFCTGAGEMPCGTAVTQMRLAYDSVMQSQESKSWLDAWASERVLQSTVG
jgi:O-acetyl-ADP-ribose deacetylase (regulator of RNase III)